MSGRDKGECGFETRWTDGEVRGDEEGEEEANIGVMLRIGNKANTQRCT